MNNDNHYFTHHAGGLSDTHFYDNLPVAVPSCLVRVTVVGLVSGESSTIRTISGDLLFSTILYVVC